MKLTTLVLLPAAAMATLAVQTATAANTVAPDCTQKQRQSINKLLDRGQNPSKACYAKVNGNPLELSTSLLCPIKECRSWIDYLAEELPDCVYDLTNYGRAFKEKALDCKDPGSDAGDGKGDGDTGKDNSKGDDDTGKDNSKGDDDTGKDNSKSDDELVESDSGSSSGSGSDDGKKPTPKPTKDAESSSGSNDIETPGKLITSPPPTTAPVEVTPEPSGVARSVVSSAVCALVVAVAATLTL